MIIKRIGVLLISCALAAGSLLLASPPASATSCTAVAFTSGDGSSGNPYLIDTVGHLQYLHQTPGMWNSGHSFRLTNDIDLTGCPWTYGLGDYVRNASGFRGTLDGDGHVISGFSLSTTNGYGGLFDVLTGGSIVDLGVTGTITITASGMRSAYVYAGGLIAEAGFNGGSVIRSYSDVAISVTGSASYGCDMMMMCSAALITYAGGIFGSSSTNWTITDSYAQGDVTATLSTSGGSEIMMVYAGGLVGIQTSGGSPPYPAKITRSYSTGALNLTTTMTAPATPTLYVGGFAGYMVAPAEASFWDTDSSQRSTGVGFTTLSGGDQPTGKTTPEIQTYATYSGWGSSITDGYSASSTWGICSAVNGGEPFLSAFYSTNPCASAPMISGVAPSTGPVSGGTSVVITGTDLMGASAVTFGGAAASNYTVDSATQITATSPSGTAGSADVAVTTSGGTATSSNAFTYERLSQTVSWNPVTSLRTTSSPATPSALASALGGATVTYAVTSTTNGCTVDASTGVLTFASAGSCTVRATAAQTATYAAGSTDVTFTVTAPGGGGGSGGGGGGSSSGATSSGSSTPSSTSGGVATATYTGPPPITPQPPAQSPDAGEAMSTVNGTAVPSVVEQGPRRTTVTTGTMTFSLERLGPPRRSSTGRDAFRTGVPIPFGATGLAPGTPVTVYAMSTPVLVATAVADAAGRVSGMIALPTSLSAGRHTLVVSGYLPGEAPISSYLGIVAMPARNHVTQRVLFAYDSSRLDVRAQATLDALITRTRAKAEEPVTVSVGVVRATGARPSDTRLARARATRVAEYLREHGMPGTVRVGRSIPTTLKTSEARRVEVTVSWS